MHTANKWNMANFLTAYLLSAFGYEFIFFGMTLYVYEMSQSAFKVGVFVALTFLPRIFASFYGIIADQYSRKKVFAWVTAITGCLVALMVLHSDIAWIYLVWLLISVFLTFIFNVRTALMTEIMTQDNYLHGNSLVLILLNSAKVCAPLLAGLVSTTLGVTSLFYCTSIIYFMASVFCTQIRLPSVITATKNQKTIAGLKEALQYMKGNQDVRFLLSVGVLWRLFIGLQVSLFVIYIKSYLARSDTDYGLFMTAIGVGSILGSLVGPWLVKRVPYSSLIFWGLSLHYASFILLGLLHDFYAALILVFLSYIVFYSTLVGLHSLRDKATLIHMRGRVYGSVTAIMTPPAIISMLAGGYLANLFGVEKILIGAGITALVSFHLLNLSKSFSSNNANEFSNEA
ncbi:MFS transporter [Sporomusa malonica]|uniref:Na+/melibiose symporter n=1 Tax=Sporomusa malonica TaxID=112901 RepID=A0A1W2EU13_9FIRM|nr:MFS transporter [Sporomusa malonica]SMD13072.1 Na+/melibiose symporter [Sporomusa malonica]